MNVFHLDEDGPTSEPIEILWWYHLFDQTASFHSDWYYFHINQCCVIPFQQATHSLTELHQPTFWSILQKFASIPHNSILRTFLFNDRYLMCLGVVTDMVLGFSSNAHMISWLVGFYLWPKLVTSRQQQEQHFCKADLLAWFLPIGKFVKVLWQAVSLSIRFLWISLQTYLWSIDLSGYKLRLFKLSCCWDD